MEQLNGRIKEVSSPSTLLATPKQKQEFSGDETLLVTETFHHSPKNDTVLFRLQAWLQERRAWLIVACICIVIGVVGIMYYQNSLYIDPEVISEKQPDKTQQNPITPSHKENIVAREVETTSEEKPPAMENHADEKLISENLSAPAPKETEKEHSTNTSTQTLTGIQPTTQEINHVSSPSASASAFSNVFTYGRQTGSLLTAPGTAEANLRSSRMRNNTTFSYGQQRETTRTRRRNNNSLSFTIKESGTRSVNQ